MLVYVFRLPTPGGPLASEVADEFLLLRIHAQDRAAGIFKHLSELGDKLELSVAIRVLRLGDAFAVNPERVFLVLEQLAHGIGTNRRSNSLHLSAEQSSVFPAPLLIGHGITSRVRLH
jgi:hypothetical protein